MRRLRQYTEGDAERIERAVRLLRDACQELGRANARQALVRTRSALKSAEGAQRHADRLRWLYTQERARAAGVIQ